MCACLLLLCAVAVEESTRRLSALEGVDATAARLTAESQRLREKLEQAEGQVRLGQGLAANTEPSSSYRPALPAAGLQQRPPPLFVHLMVMQLVR